MIYQAKHCVKPPRLMQSRIIQNPNSNFKHIIHSLTHTNIINLACDTKGSNTKRNYNSDHQKAQCITETDPWTRIPLFDNSQMPPSKSKNLDINEADTSDKPLTHTRSIKAIKIVTSNEKGSIFQIVKIRKFHEEIIIYGKKQIWKEKPNENGEKALPLEKPERGEEEEKGVKFPIHFCQFLFCSFKKKFKAFSCYCRVQRRGFGFLLTGVNDCD